MKETRSTRWKPLRAHKSIYSEHPQTHKSYNSPTCEEIVPLTQESLRDLQIPWQRPLRSSKLSWINPQKKRRILHPHLNSKCPLTEITDCWATWQGCLRGAGSNTRSDIGEDKNNYATSGMKNTRMRSGSFLTSSNLPFTFGLDG
jgi:hypothetical protein